MLIDQVEEVYAEAGSRKDWSAIAPEALVPPPPPPLSPPPPRSAVRFAASLLHKQVDSLSPSITAIVVREKEVCHEWTALS